MEDQTQIMFDLIDMNDDNPCLGSPSQLSAGTQSADLQVRPSTTSNQTDHVPCQESSTELRPSQGASLSSYGNPGETLSPSHQSAKELGNRASCAMADIESFQNLGGIPCTPASSIFEDDFVASPVASSPVWSHCSGATDDPGRTFVAGTFSASTSGHFVTGVSAVNSVASSPPNLSIVSTAVGLNAAATAGLNSQVLVDASAPLANLCEFNHVEDSPSPVPSMPTATDTSEAGNQSNCSDKRRACVSLQHLFDAEASALTQQQVDESMLIENMCTGYLNPMPAFSDGEAKSLFDAVDGNCEGQSLMSYDASPWKPGSSRQDEEAHPSPSATSFNTVISEGPICRICHEGEQASENLISPCRCTGTLQYLHRKCLEQWLQTKSEDVCELCNFEFHTRRRTRPLKEWFRHPSNPRDTRNFAVDLASALILTPMVTVSAWLCLSGSSHYLHHQERSLESLGLILLAVVLIVIYSVWFLLTARYHYMVWREWSKHNQLVTVLTQTTPVTPQGVNTTPDRTTERGETNTTVSMSNSSSQVHASCA